MILLLYVEIKKNIIWCRKMYKQHTNQHEITETIPYRYANKKWGFYFCLFSGRQTIKRRRIPFVKETQK